MRRQSFSLTEILLAFIILSGILPLCLSTIGSLAKTYRHLRVEGSCETIADEVFSQMIISLASNGTKTDLQEPEEQSHIITLGKEQYQVRYVVAKIDSEEEKSVFPISCTVTVTSSIPSVTPAYRTTIICAEKV